MKQDCYELLGLQKGAGAEEIKKAYRTLAMKYHPDRNPGDKAAEQKFKEATEAYEILKDPEKRAAYDRFGHAAFQQGGGPQGGAGGFGFAGNFGDIFDEVFGDILGGGHGAGAREGGREGGRRGNDLRYDLEISLQEAYRGCEKTIKVSRLHSCDDCKGLGAEPGTSTRQCGTCRGSGRVRMTQGFFAIERPCASCQGAGQVITNPCAVCRGQGRVRREKTLAVSIPAGVDEGTRIRLSQEGEAGLRGNTAGDLYVFLSMAPHAFFQREGAHLLCRLPLGIVEAALGGQVEVPTIDGHLEKLEIPAGTQTGQRFCLRGFGMKPLNARVRGDLFMEAFVETPVKLSKKQKELLRQFAEDNENRHQPEVAGFFSKIKEWLVPKSEAGKAEAEKAAEKPASRKAEGH